MIAEEGLAEDLLCDLADLFTQVGLPMNPDKKITPSTFITCLGITIDIFNSTLSIDHQKLSSIYQECIGVRGKKYLSKKSY